MLKPFNLMQWIADNKSLLEPPVCNKAIYHDNDFIFMVVGGPNQRKDYHYNEGSEIFYQIKGHMVLKIREGDTIQDIRINEGELFQLPPKIPHSPQRFADTVGIVIERKRLPNEQDGLMWYCDDCQSLLYEEYFHLNNIEKDLPPVFKRYASKTENRTCNACQAVMEV